MEHRAQPASRARRGPRPGGRLARRLAHRHQRRAVAATAAALAALLSAGPAHVMYTVRPGDTLSGIAARTGSRVTDLAAANGIANPNRILAGQVLAIPDGPATRSHVVRPGDTLSVIAKQAGIGVADLAASNGITDPDRILVGSRLTIPSGPVAALRADRRWHCPVVEPTRFVNDFGVAKPDGRFHEGIDVYAPRGTAVVAPVAGHARQVNGARGGYQVWLDAEDGTTYIASHLDGFGAAGPVAAGTVIGVVGDSGNARGTRPHVHFEMHPGGGPATNPFPLLRAACR